MFLPAIRHSPDQPLCPRGLESADDKRRSCRRSFVLYIALVESGTDGELCRVQNLSADGLMAEFVQPMTMGQAVRLNLPDTGRAAGRVVWVKGRYAGVRFGTAVDIAAVATRKLASAADLMLQHEFIGTLAAALAKTATGPEPVDIVSCQATRQRLTHALRAHLKQEDWAVYPELLRSADPRIAEAAARFRDELGGLNVLLDDYTQQWFASAMAADWPGFCSATRELLAALAERAGREDAELYPLLTAARS